MPVSRITNKDGFPAAECGAVQDERFMTLALAQAERCAKRGEVPVGAVLVKDGRVLAKAGNTRERRHDPAGHAELNALRRAAARLGGWNLHDCVLYVTLEPCPMCAGACVNARIKRIVYGAADSKAGACGSVINLCRGFNHSPEVCGGVLEEKCAGLLTGFFRRRREEQKAQGKKPKCGSRT